MRSAVQVIRDRSSAVLVAEPGQAGLRPQAGLAARTAPEAPTQPAEATTTCNIGPAELRRRRSSALVAALALVVALAALAAGILPTWTLPWLAPLFGAVVGTALQVWLRFCMAFGLAGVAGMGSEPGSRALDPALRAGHRRRAVLMLAAAAVATLAWAVVTGVLVIVTG